MLIFFQIDDSKSKALNLHEFINIVAKEKAMLYQKKKDPQK
jgi:hypothetical protein